MMENYVHQTNRGDFYHDIIQIYPWQNKEMISKRNKMAYKTYRKQIYIYTKL